MILENNSFDNKTIEKFNFYVYGLIDPYSEDIFHFIRIKIIFERDVKEYGNEIKPGFNIKEIKDE